MHYAVEGDDLCIRIPLDAIAKQAVARRFGPIRVLNRAALAMAMGRELCECEDAGEEPYLSKPLDAAIVRVIESADPSLEFSETE
jgi:hypothetical protein